MFSVVGLKLEAHPLTIATAAILYHRFMKEAAPQGYDNYVRENVSNYCIILTLLSRNVTCFIYFSL